MDDLGDITRKYGTNLDYRRMSKYQITFLKELSITNLDVVVEGFNGLKKNILNMTDTYNGKGELTARVHGIIRLPEYKVAAKDFNPKESMASTEYLFTLKDKSQIRVVFKSKQTIKLG